MLMMFPKPVGIHQLQGTDDYNAESLIEVDANLF
jgi:hypothetical protein